MSYLRRTRRTHADNVFEPLIDGEAAYGALLAALQRARKYIYLVSWYFEPDLELTRAASTNPQLREILLDKARSRIEVKVLAWNQNIAIRPIGSVAVLFQRDLRRFQQELGAVNPRSRSAMLIPENTHLPRGRLFRTGSHHQKFWIMDDGGRGATGFVCGLNLGQHEWDTPEHRVDDARRTAPGLDRMGAQLMASLSHPAMRESLRQLIAALLDRYLHLDAILNRLLRDVLHLSDPTLTLVKARIKREVVDQVIEHLEPFPTRHDIASHMQGPVLQELLEEFRVRWSDAAAARTTVAAPPSTAPQNGRSTVQVGHTSHLRSPCRNDDIWLSYRHAVRMARSFIYFENQYFVSEELAIEVARVLRGRREIRFVLVLPNKAEDFLVGPAIANRQRVLVNSITNAAREATPREQRVFVYTIMNWNPAKHSHDGIYVHSKVGIIDDRWMTIGSANASKRSFEYDTELNTFLDDRNQSMTFRQKLWAEHAQVREDQVRDPLRAIRLMEERATANDRIVRRGSGALSWRLVHLSLPPPPRDWLHKAYELLVREFL